MFALVNAYRAFMGNRTFVLAPADSQADTKSSTSRTPAARKVFAARTPSDASSSFPGPVISPSLELHALKYA